MTQSISKPLSNNSSNSSSGSSSNSMEAKKVIGNGSLVSSGNTFNNTNNSNSSFGQQQQTIANGNNNGLYRQSQRSNSNLNEKTRKNSGNGSRNFKSRNNGGDNEFIMLQRPTILVKPSTASTIAITANTTTSIQETEAKLSNEVTILAATGIESKLSRTREPTPDTYKLNNPKLLTSNGENIISNGKVKAINLVNVTNSSNETIVNGINSNNNILVNNNNKIKAKRELMTPLINNQKENSHLQQSVASYTVAASSNVSAQNPQSSAQLLSNPVVMTKSVKVLDDNLQWSDSLQEYLIDQNDFLVIGVLGKRGVGKSTLMSLLANGRIDEGLVGMESRRTGKNSDRSKPTCELFGKASKDSNELGQHRTSGIQAFVTNERTILLDVQPLLGGSALDKSINIDKKGGSLSNNNDFKYYENFIEIQSIELACFILSVCNVVLLTEDWFVDPSLFKILHTAEMLMPNVSMNLSSGNTSNNNSNANPGFVTSTGQYSESESNLEHHAHLVYVLNKSEFVNKLDMVKMKSTVDYLMKGSKLNYKNSLREYNWFGGMNSSTKNSNRKDFKMNKQRDCVNFVVIPKIKQPIKNATLRDGYDEDDAEMSAFNSFPSFEKSAKYLVRELLSVKRNVSSQASASGVLNNVSGAHVTEKRWFLYANKVWEAIRKSQMINEYNRLMT